ncbi:MAG: sugar ABC transporter permease [Limnochordales bacterium]|nr:sugar ABC transporter permease [Limnochordales bacterium]
METQTAGTLAHRPSVARRRMRAETRLGWMLVTPALALLAAVYLYPAVMTLLFSFSRISLSELSIEGLVGLQYYRAALNNEAFIATVLRTLKFGFTIVVLTLVISFPIALLLHRPFFGRGIVRTAVLLPWAIPPVVSSVLWGQMFHAEAGFINGLIRAFGGEPRIWLGDPNLAFYSIIVVEVWRAIPLATLFMLAGLSTLPDSIYEAATIDGATKWQQFRHLTLPLMQPVVIPIVIFQFIFSMKAFDSIFVLTRGGPVQSTTTLNYLAYQQWFQQLRMGQSAATAYILLLLTLVVIGVMGLVRWAAERRMGGAGR